MWWKSAESSSCQCSSKPSSPGIFQKSLIGGSAMLDIPAINIAPPSVWTPTEAPLMTWTATLPYRAGFRELINRLLCQIAINIISQCSHLKANDRFCCILDFNIGVIQIGTTAKELVNRSHEPLQNVQLMRCLIHQHTATLADPSSSPSIALVVG